MQGYEKEKLLKQLYCISGLTQVFIGKCKCVQAVINILCNA